MSFNSSFQVYAVLKLIPPTTSPHSWFFVLNHHQQGQVQLHENERNQNSNLWFRKMSKNYCNIHQIISNQGFLWSGSVVALSSFFSQGQVARKNDLTIYSKTRTRFCLALKFWVFQYSPISYRKPWHIKQGYSWFISIPRVDLHNLFDFRVDFLFATAYLVKTIEEQQIISPFFFSNKSLILTNRGREKTYSQVTWIDRYSLDSVVWSQFSTIYPFIVIKFKEIQTFFCIASTVEQFFFAIPLYKIANWCPIFLFTDRYQAIVVFQYRRWLFFEPWLGHQLTH